jgi:hypothetical protein
MHFCSWPLRLQLQVEVREVRTRAPVHKEATGYRQDAYSHSNRETINLNSFVIFTKITVHISHIMS